MGVWIITVRYVQALTASDSNKNGRIPLVSYMARPMAFRKSIFFYYNFTIMTYINTVWLELQWQHVRCTEPSEGSADRKAWWPVLLYIPEISHTLDHMSKQDNKVYKAKADSGNRSTNVWTIWKASLYEIYWFGYEVTKVNPKTTRLSDTWPIATQTLWRASQMRGCRSTHLKPQHLWSWGRSIAWPRPDWATYCIRDHTGL